MQLAINPVLYSAKHLSSCYFLTQPQIVITLNAVTGWPKCILADFTTRDLLFQLRPLFAPLSHLLKPLILRAHGGDYSWRGMQPLPRFWRLGSIETFTPSGPRFERLTLVELLSHRLLGTDLPRPYSKVVCPGEL